MPSLPRDATRNLSSSTWQLDPQEVSLSWTDSHLWPRIRRSAVRPHALWKRHTRATPLTFLYRC